jgi:hypothetical protein
MTEATRSGEGEHAIHEPATGHGVASGHEPATGHDDADAHAPATNDHDEAPLGPIDTAAWGASLLGVAAGLLVCFLLYLAVT